MSAVPTVAVTGSAPPGPSAVGRWWLVVLLLVVAAGSAVAAAPVYLHGIAAHPFPSYIDGEPPYQVDRYSAPWIAGGLALGGLAVLLLVVAVDLAVHRRGGRRASVTDGAPR